MSTVIAVRWDAVTAIATIVYVIAFLVTAIYLHYQLSESIRSRKLEVDLALTAERSRSEDLDKHRELHEWYCDHGFRFNMDEAPPELRRYVAQLLRSLNRIGLLLDSRYLDQTSPSISTRASYFVRVWLILEDHVKEARLRSGFRTHYAPTQRLAVVAFQNFLSDPCAEMNIYHPGNKDLLAKHYSRADLQMKLEELEAEMAKWPKQVARKRFRWG